MLATFVIGLREGLEAALIVGIIAAFLKRNGHRLTGMWIGVAAAILLSIGVGVTLAAIEQALPQAAQEGMESVIGVVAVVFVTGMIVWMNRNSRGMKHELEGEAGAALQSRHTTALVVMAFLAVLKEGFETSVFLLATLSAASNTLLAALGALLGIVVAIALGVGIYYGGVRIDLGRFFRVTGAFLILVAAGLVLSTLRTAHEAGWITGGQQRTIDLSGVVTPGSIPSALITGVLGIPADPRLIELIGWALYLVTVTLYVYWPGSRRLAPPAARRLQRGIAIACVIGAAALAVGFSLPRSGPEQTLPIAVGAVSAGDVDAGAHGTTTVGTVSLAGDRLAVTVGNESTEQVDLAPASDTSDHAGWPAAARTWTSTPDVAAPATLSLADVATLNGGRLPIGISRTQQPGPFDASWQITDDGTAWVADGHLIDAVLTRQAVVTLSGGGLTTPRSVTLASSDPAHPDAGWHVVTTAVDAQVTALADEASFAEERALWGIHVPVALVLAAIVLVVFAARSQRRAGRERPSPDVPPPEPSPTESRTIHAH